MPQGRCPKCNQLLEYKDSLHMSTANTGYCPVYCNCGFEGEEHYNVNFNCIYDIDDDRRYE